MYRIYSLCAAITLLVVACTAPVQKDTIGDLMVSSGPNDTNNTDVANTVAATLLQGVKDLHASAGSAVLMDAQTGKIINWTSIITRSQFEEESDYTYDRAINSTQEPGRVAAIFSLAQAIDRGDIKVDEKRSFPRVVQGSSGFKITDQLLRPDDLTPSDVMLYSSNASNAHVARLIGVENQKEFLAGLGLLKPNLLERTAPSKVKPLLPTRWTETTSMTVAFGYGFSASPVQLAAAYSTLVNGGRRVCPSLNGTLCVRSRLVSQGTSKALRQILADYMNQRYGKQISGLDVAIGGVSGSSELRLINGSFEANRRVTTFATAFPIDKPAFVLVVQLEDAKKIIQGQEHRNSGNTVVPLGLKVVQRLN